MKKIFVNAESSYELKRLGFVEDCLAFYDEDGEMWFDLSNYDLGSEMWNNLSKYDKQKHIKAPVYTQAIQFLDTFDKLYIEVTISGVMDKYNVCVNKFLCDENGEWLKLDFYEAYEKAIEESIKILKKL